MDEIIIFLISSVVVCGLMCALTAPISDVINKIRIKKAVKAPFKFLNGEVVIEKRLEDNYVIGVEWLGSNGNMYYNELYVDKDFNGYQVGDKYPKKGEENRIPIEDRDKLVKSNWWEEKPDKE